jgi:peptide/nickel transport system ATP-binding protein
VKRATSEVIRLQPALPLLAVDDLSVGYAIGSAVLPAVRNVSLALRRGEVLGVVGESGSGKSTLAQAVMGYCGAATVIPSGKVVFDGIALLGASDAALRGLWGRRIAMVHQNPLATLTPTMVVGDQIVEVIRQHRPVGRLEARQRMIAALEAVNLPKAQELARRYPHQLSGGERQRISIAIALCLEPDLLVLDEPTTNLDATTEAGILDLLEAIKARGRTAMIYISHNLGVIARIADRVAVMYAGEIVETGGVRPIFRSACHPYTQALLACLPRPGFTKRQASLQSVPAAATTARQSDDGCRFRDRCHSRSAACEVSPGWMPIAETHAVRCWHARAVPTSGLRRDQPATAVWPGSERVLDVAGLGKSFASRSPGALMPRRLPAVSSASLHVPEGSIVGLVGESGSGKSTLLRCIAGLEAPDEGRITFMGLDVPAELAKRPRSMLTAVQMIFQDPESTLNPALTVGENLRRHLRALRPMDDASASSKIDRALEQVQLNLRYRERLPLELSGGEKQRVAIARAFLSQPKLVLCDEPLSALDVSVQSAICQLLLDLQRNGQNSYVFVSHDLSIVRYLADYIVVMYLGEIVEEGEAESFDRRPVHPYSEALFSATPVPDPEAERSRILLSGQISDVDKAKPGCIFSARCPRRKGEICYDAKPDWQSVEGRRYRCHWTATELSKQQDLAHQGTGDRR